MINHSLESHVYGPYPHDVLFNKRFSVAGQVPVLSNLQMLCNDMPIGFDETEYIVTPPPNSIVTRHPVYFSGVLQIESLDWLSEQGLRCLETDFKNYDRDSNIHRENNKSRLTLQRLYGSSLDKRFWIKVRVVYEKVLFAAYMTSKNQHGKLLIYGKLKTGHTTFSVKSLQKGTYDMSRNFLDRYRLRALIVELIEFDQGKTPLADRNIDWLLDRYFQYIIPRDLKNRIMTDPSTEREILLEPRHPRHISHAEIRGYFASQAEWLLANQLASLSTSANVKLVDIPQWISFCLQVRVEVVDASNNGIKWGIPHKIGQELKSHRKWSLQNIPLSQRLAKYGQTESFWAKKLENVDAQRKAGETEQCRSISPHIESLQTSMPVVVSQFQYDSDFSEASTNDASSDSEDESLYPNSKIPHFCLIPPDIPNGRFVWNCRGCDFYIDLLNLSPDILNHLSDDTKRGLGGKSWKIKEGPVQRLLFQTVSKHYRDNHLSDGASTTIQASGNKWYVKDCSGRSKKQRDRKPYTHVKVKEELD